MTKKGFSTQTLHCDRMAGVKHGSLHKPVHTSIAFEHEKAEDIAHIFQGKKAGYTYARQVNPTVTALEQKITKMEDGVATACFSTGMAAITATMLALLRSGDHLISSTFLFGNTNSLFNTLQQFGVEVTFVDATDVSEVEKAIKPNTRAVFVETIANPRTQITDLANIGDLCEARNLVYIVDNTITSPYYFRPKSVKCSLIIHSLSKVICGHGNALGGSVTETGLYDWASYDNLYDNYKKGAPSNWGLIQIKKKGLRDMGGTLDPQAAHRIAIGAETLSLRIDKASDNTLRLAKAFEDHPLITHVYYPGLENHPEHKRGKSLFKGFGSLMSIDLDPSVDCFGYLDKLQYAALAANLGDNRTLAIPVAHTIFYEMGPERRASMGIQDGTVRLSIGIENFEDLLEDFLQAFES